MLEITERELAREHIHLLRSCPPREAIGDVVRILKGKSAQTSVREFSGLRRTLGAGKLQEDGYFVRTVSNRVTSKVIERYIRSPRELEQETAQRVLNLR